MAPRLFDLTWKSSAAQPDLPTDVYPYLGYAIYRNNPYTLHFALLDGTTPVEIEGVMAAQIRLARFAVDPGTPETIPDPIAEFEVTVGGVDGNEVTATLTPAQTIQIPDACYWDLEQYIDDEPVATWYTGKVKAWGDITRPVTP